MDTPTTMVMAATAAAALTPERARVAGVALAVAGALLPDLDVLVLRDTMDTVRWHRGPSHSLLFCALAAPALAWAARLLGSKAPMGALIGSAGLGLALALATDVITWWGTVLLWPFSWHRYDVGLVFIIDLWLSALALAPWTVALAQKLRRKCFPRPVFVAASAAMLAYLAVCAAARALAWQCAEERALEWGAAVVDVFPQPLSPLRWSLALERGPELELTFIDHARGREPLDRRRYDRGLHGPAELTDATDVAQTLLWFYKLPIREHSTDERGRALVTYRDLAYEAWFPPRLAIERSPPFRYRFVLEEGHIHSQGFVRER